MDCRFQCISVILLLVVLATHAFLEDYSPINRRRLKRALVETSECKKEIEDNGMDLINYGIEVLTKGAVKIRQCPFIDSLKSVFNFLQKNRNDIKLRITETLKQGYRTGYATLNKAKDLSKLESTLIYMYTDDDIYKDLNFALSQHKCTKKTLDQKDKELAPYAAALLATLLYWEKLPGDKGTTYRMIGGVRGDINSALKSYQKGKSVVFPAFTSSTNLIDAAFNFIGESIKDNNILLIIDNSTPSLWRPKDIQSYSKYPDEREFLYPSVAKFRVLDKPVKKARDQRSYYEIRLQLDGQKLKENLLQKIRRVCRMN